MIFYTSDPKNKNTPLLIYSPPKNSTFMYEVTFLLKKLLFFMLSFYLHYTELVLRERGWWAKLN